MNLVELVRLIEGTQTERLKDLKISPSKRQIVTTQLLEVDPKKCPIVVYINKLSDIQINFKSVQTHTRNLSIKIQKDISSRAGDILKVVGFQ